ncbi:MAG: alpha/beta fold hydrolase, partial [Kiloniellales bacterium]
MGGRRIDGTVFQTEGNGPPVVLVHGLGLNRNMWTWQIDALAGRFFLVRYDLLGHGESDKPPGP